MENTIILQLYLLLIFVITGIIIGIFFDIFRILRKSFKTPDIITYIEDVIFWILSGLFFLYILFIYNNGEIRSYVIIGLLLGILLYFLLISKYFIKINVLIINFVKTIILNVIIKPIKILLKLLRKILKPFSFVVINIRKNIVDFCNKNFQKVKNRKIFRKHILEKKDFKNKCRKI